MKRKGKVFKSNNNTSNLVIGTNTINSLYSYYIHPKWEVGV